MAQQQQQIVEVSDMFWELVERSARASDKPTAAVVDLQLPGGHGTGCAVMLTGETIALPLAYFMRRREEAALDRIDGECLMQCEYVYDDLPAMMAAVLEMYEDAACSRHETMLHRRRRRELRLAMRLYAPTATLVTNVRIEST